MTREKLSALKEKLEAIERHILELEAMGQGMPVVEKNVKMLLSIVYVLKLGVSEIAEIEE